MRIARIALLILVAFLIYKASMLVYEDASFSAVASFGRQATRSDDVEKAATSAALSGMVNTCRGDFIGPGTRIHMLNLDKQDAAKNFAEWSNAFEAAQSFTKAALRCAPYNSDAWIRYGLVSQAAVEEPERLSRILDNSVALNPYEREQLYARLVLWQKISPETLRRSQASLQADLGTILGYGDRLLVAKLLNTRSEPLRQAAEMALGQQSSERQAQIGGWKAEVQPAAN